MQTLLLPLRPCYAKMLFDGPQPYKMISPNWNKPWRQPLFLLFQISNYHSSWKPMCSASSWELFGLTQRGYAIAFFSKLFCLRMQHASTYVRELHAITTAMRKWRQYLLGHKFTILTDHRSLRELMSQIIQTLEQQFYLAKLLGFDYDIQYKTRVSNIVADSLSRIDMSSPSTYFILFVPNFTLMSQLKQSISTCPTYQTQLNSIV